MSKRRGNGQSGPPDSPKIAMTPDQLPTQRVHEVIELPHVPQDLDPVGCCGWEPDEIVPKARPRDMQYLGSVEWAWAPMSGRIEAYHLHRGRKNWLLYAQDLDPNDPEFAWTVVAYGNRKGVEPREAAIHLIMASWRTENADFGLDHFHWINQDGYQKPRSTSGRR